MERGQSVSFNDNEKKSVNANLRKPSEIETPRGPVPRPETLEALGSLSAQSYREEMSNEQKWPRDWRAYVCLFGGFLLMFNSWYVSVTSTPR